MVKQYKINRKPIPWEFNYFELDQPVSEIKLEDVIEEATFSLSDKKEKE